MTKTRALCPHCGLTTAQNDICIICKRPIKTAAKVAQEWQELALMETYVAVLNRSYEVKRDVFNAMGISLSRLQFVAMFIFEFVESDEKLLDDLATMGLSVAAAINRDQTQKYCLPPVEWFHLILSSPFFVGRIDRTVDFSSSATRSIFWRHDDKEIYGMRLTYKKWKLFIDALVLFASR